MFSEELRNRMLTQLSENPEAVAKEIQNNPNLLKALLDSDKQLAQTQQQLDNERNERIKYVNMTAAREDELRQKAVELRTTQGALLGLGLLMLLSALSKK